MFDLYLKQNLINKSNINESGKFNNLEYSISSINNKILSKIFEASYNEDISLSLIKNNKCIIQQTFKKIKIESFEIKSSYKNINILTNGEIIKNKKYKMFIENLIKKNMHMNISNYNSDKTSTSMISYNTKLENIKEINLIKNKKEKGKNKEDGTFYSEGINSKIAKNKFINIISDENKKISSKNFYYQNNDHNNEKIYDNIKDKKNQNIKISSNSFEKKIENKNTFKKVDLLAQQNEDINNIDNNSIQSININNIEGKQLYTSKKSNNFNHKQSNSNIFFKKLFEKNNSKRDDLFFSQNNNSFTKMIKINNNNEEKEKICEIY